MTPLSPQPHTHHPVHSYTQGHYTKLAPEEWTSLFTAGAGSLVIPLGGGGGRDGVSLTAALSDCKHELLQHPVPNVSQV